MRWGIAAWRQGVTHITIANCWVKSRVLGPKYGPLMKSAAIENGWEEAVAQDTARIDETERQLGSSIKVLVEQERIQSAMSISVFLNPADEAVDDDDEEILDSVVEAYSEGDRAQETDEEPVEVIPVRSQEALQAVRLLQSYEEQQDDGESDVIRRLAQLEVVVRGRIFAGRQQTQITSYFT
jgi:hypothetical protein